MLAVGLRRGDVARDFDRYWASASAYPVERILPHADAGQLDALERKAKAIEQDPAAEAYIDALRGPHVVQKMLDETLPFEWAKTEMISDDPAKGLNNAPPEALISHQLSGSGWASPRTANSIWCRRISCRPHRARST